MDDADLRPLRRDEGCLLRTATLGNLNWCGERFTPDDVRERPDFSHYATLDPDRGDVGVVAEIHGVPAGVCWAQFLSSDDPGYRFVDDVTPEVSLWVAPEFRQRGIGRRLLEALIEEARVRGFTHVSLSVETGNQAKELYRSVGFEDVAGREDDGVMVLTL